MKTHEIVTRPRRFRSILVIVTLSGIAMLPACAQVDRPPDENYPLTIWNRSQFELLEIYVHSGEDYAETENVLAAPLPVDNAVEIDPFEQTYRVTFVRTERNLGDRFSFTTNEGIELEGPGYTLEVFDEWFRLLEPTAPSNPYGTE